MLNRDLTWFYDRSAGELSAKIVENTVVIVGSLGNEFRGLFYFYGFLSSLTVIGNLSSWSVQLSWSWFWNALLFGVNVGYNISMDGLLLKLGSCG